MGGGARLRLNAKQILSYTGGRFLVEPIDPSALYTGITFDSRDVHSDWLYVALPGARVDGHQFVDEALRKGALGALVTDMPSEATKTLARELGAALIEVPNTMHAITDIAKEWRAHLCGHVIGITGSTGKTTTKNLVRDVLATKYRVVATKANQNNELGVPMTLLAAEPETEMVIVEMGMRGAGQITELCRIARPEWGLVTNVSECHIELLGSLANIAAAKAELLFELPAGTGRAFVNAQDASTPQLVEAAQLARRDVHTFTFAGEAQGGVETDYPVRARVWAEDVSLDAEGRPVFSLCSIGFDGVGLEKTRCKLGLHGMHNISNACAATAIARSCGMPLHMIALALADVLPESGRQEVLRARVGSTVVNDAYNANPDSMKASLSSFRALPVSGRRIAVLGDMGELGDYAEACHTSVGAFAAGCDLDMLICVGELSRSIAKAARTEGMADDRIIEANTVADVLEVLDAHLEPDDAVLVKASHFMNLDRVVEGLVN